MSHLLKSGHASIQWYGRKQQLNESSSITKSQNVCTCSPGVDLVGGSWPPEQFAQVLFNTVPQDVTGALTLFAAAHHELVKVGSAMVHRLRGDDGCRTIAEESEFRFMYLIEWMTPTGLGWARKTACWLQLRHWSGSKCGHRFTGTAARTLQRGRWSGGVPAEIRCSPASEFYQTTCWWEPADARHRSHPESCAYAHTHTQNSHFLKRPEMICSIFCSCMLVPEKAAQRSESKSYVPVYGVSVFKECPRPWARRTDRKYKWVTENSFS